MRVRVEFDVEGPPERFVQEEWPLMLERLYTMPQYALYEESSDNWRPLSIAIPTEEGEVKP